MTILKYATPLLMALTIAGCNQSAPEKPKTDESVETPITGSADDSTSSEVANDNDIDTPLTAPPINEDISASEDKSAVTQTYNVLLDASYPPFAFEDADGNIKGFDLDILEAAGAASGFKADFNTDYWDGIFTKLDEGSTDIIASGIPITPQRRSEALFSDPYINEHIVIAYHSAEPKTFDQLSDGMIAVEMGSPLLTTLHNLNVDENNIIEYPASFDAIPDLISDEIDGVVDDKAIIQYHINTMQQGTDIGQIKMVDLPNSEDGKRAFAIKKGRTEVAEQLNEGLETIKENGQYDAIYKKWFGVAPGV